MKIQRVELKEVEIVELDGEFERRFVNAKVHPAFLTNAAVKKGYDMGLLASSLFEDLLKIKGLETLVSQADEENSLELLNAFDEQKLIAVIYLAVLGANKNIGLSFEEFLDVYHQPLTETIKLYATLITGLLSESNEFAQALHKQTKKSKKKHRHQS
ncbi:hypothetical protein [Lysinibacillus parviboronicapiens]|uniref:hypothetical protein n=1 Tax=Lysinibacillus parviboronicapiens TaxID=436516 RepID=UPI000D39ED17|nr:hypothetical protein [Lysinibacillus parviboronicapiens]